MEGKTKLNNRLWQIRHKIGLEQKQVARLLGHKTTDQISRYERGRSVPSFKSACKLAIIYGTSLPELFPEHCEQYRREILDRAEAFSASLNFKIDENSANENEQPEKSVSQPVEREAVQDAALCH